MKFKIGVYIPLTSKEAVKAAMFKAGAGKIGNYDCCAFEVQGTGQFRPLEGSNPVIGQQHQLEQVQEVRVEMICAGEYLHAALEAMKTAHPYEVVAYDVIELVNV